MSEEVLRGVDEAEAVLAAVYAAPTPGVRGSGSAVSRIDPTSVLLQNILDHAAAKTVFVAVGSPYLAQDFPAVQNYLCTFSSTPVSEASVVKALFGEIPIRGRLPVGIPNIAERDAGIEKPLE
jgi:beta-N-acetylhexosaminidase